MQEKILTILESATDYMTAKEIADAGGWRSSSNVSVAIRNMGDRVVSRKSTRKTFTNSAEPVKEFALAIKEFAKDDRVADASKTMPTDKECCNAAAVVATTASNHVANLRKQISDLEDDIRRQTQRAEAAEANRNDLRKELDHANRANDNWIKLAGEYECKSIPELRILIDSAFAKLERIKKPAGQPRKPFSVTGLVGYHAGSDKVTLFLDRRLSARSITLPTEKLNQLADMAKEAA